MNAVAMEMTKARTPVIQVALRLPRQAAMRNFTQRCTTMNMKKNSVLHKCVEFTNSPTFDLCHQAGPSTASTAPESSTTAKAPIVKAPKT